MLLYPTDLMNATYVIDIYIYIETHLGIRATCLHYVHFTLDWSIYIFVLSVDGAPQICDIRDGE